jgi:hypothetical protein
VCFKLGVDEFAIDAHVEDATPAFDQLRVDAERLFDPGSETRRRGPVVSGAAISDANIHRRLPIA